MDRADTFIVGAVLGCLLGGYLTHTGYEQWDQKRLIANGYAHYDTVTADFIFHKKEAKP